MAHDKGQDEETYKWSENTPPPQALHLDIDYQFYAGFVDAAAKLWKKGATKERCQERCR